jgi:hypothetical protein
MAVSYGDLIPEWLMSDFSALLARDKKGIQKYGGEGVYSREDFEDEYLVKREKDFDRFTRTGKFSGDTMYEYKDWTRDIEGGYDWGADKSLMRENRYLSGKEDAYTDYLEALGYTPEAGYGTGDMSSVNIFDPVSFSTAIGKAKGLGPGQVPGAGTFTAFTPDMFKGLHSGYYQEDVEEGRGSILDSLVTRTKKAQSLGGGLAGYGQRGAQKGVAQQSYLGGVEDIYAGVDEQKSATLQNIYDVLGQYETIGE